MCNVFIKMKYPNEIEGTVFDLHIYRENITVYQHYSQEILLHQILPKLIITFGVMVTLSNGFALT